MRMHDYHAGRIGHGELACLVGAMGGRVRFGTGWLYSVRVFVLFWRVEVLVTTSTKEPAERKHRMTCASRLVWGDDQSCGLPCDCDNPQPWVEVGIETGRGQDGER